MTRTIRNTTFADALAPVATKLRRRDGLVRPVSQVILRLLNDGECAPFESARTTVLEWMAKRAGKQLPDEARRGESFTLDDIGTQRTQAVSISSPRYWAARLDDADKTVAQRVWTTEIGIGEQKDGSVLLGCRLLCVTRGEDVPFERSIPRFVRDIVKQNRAELEGRPVSVEPWFIENSDQVEELVKLLRDPRRRCDVIVFSLPEDSVNPADTAASANTVAQQTLGAAHVAVITGPASFQLSDCIGKEFSVYRQAVRTYRPGFDPNKDEPFSHPLGLFDRIAEWPGGGPGAYERLLISQALARSVSGQELEQTLPPFMEVRRVATELKRIAAQEEGSSDRDLLDLADQEIKELKNDLEATKKEYDGLLAVAEKERDHAQEVAQQAQAKNLYLRRRIESLEQQLKAAGQSTEPEIPDNLEGFEDWCRKHLSGAVELHNRAFRGVEKSRYEDVSLIYKALLLLRDHYVPMKREGGIEKKRSFENACRVLGIDEQPTFSGTRYGEEGDTYFVRYGGHRVLLDRHLKKGTAHNDERYCFRLYFFWDDEEQHVVVGWLPSHLDMRIT